ncbi:hypothetical protein ZWY2020_028601 [Hordeum vulgare]|nr:hypothetical protein ZWY2020_028601 [Hordeum vulgare]
MALLFTPEHSGGPSLPPEHGDGDGSPSPPPSAAATAASGSSPTAAGGSSTPAGSPPLSVSMGAKRAYLSPVVQHDDGLVMVTLLFLVFVGRRNWPFVELWTMGSHRPALDDVNPI